MRTKAFWRDRQTRLDREPATVDDALTCLCGCSLVVKHHSSKVVSTVRFRPPAPRRHFREERTAPFKGERRQSDCQPLVKDLHDSGPWRDLPRPTSLIFKIQSPELVHEADTSHDNLAPKTRPACIINCWPKAATTSSASAARSPRPACWSWRPRGPLSHHRPHHPSVATREPYSIHFRRERGAAGEKRSPRTSPSVGVAPKPRRHL